MERFHPTKQALLNVTVKLIEEKGIDEITSEEVLDLSGISKGSLYHHFEDFADLLETAIVYRFGKFVDLSIGMLSKVIQTAKSREELIEKLKEVTRETQSPESYIARYERISAIARVSRHEKMMKQMGEEQERLTGALADLYREAVERGWGDPKFDPRTIAVLVQAYSMGKVVDDFTPSHISEANWNLLIGSIVERVLFPKK